MWAEAIQAAGEAAGALSGGGGQRPHDMRSYLGSRGQMELFDLLINRAKTGQGEYGFGPAARQGTATLRHAMAGRGVSPGSGMYNSALAQLLAKAASDDTANRWNVGFQAATMRPWVEQAQKYMGGFFTDYQRGKNRPAWAAGGGGGNPFAPAYQRNTYAPR